MRKKTYGRLACAAAALALLLTGCGKGSSSGSSSMSGSSPMGSSTTTQDSQQAAWRTGLGVRTDTEQKDRTGKISTAAAAVVLDKDGKIVQLTVDELQADVATDGTGAVTMAETYRSKREMGESYDKPLAAVSSIEKGWSEQVDAFATYLIGMTGEQVAMLELDSDGYASDPDLMAGCTIAVDGYRDAVARACRNAEALGASEGDTLALGIVAEASSKNSNAIDDKDGTAGVKLTIAALTKDGDGRVTSAVCDVTEPALTVVADGGMHEPDNVMTHLEQGDDYGMREASSLGKEWYEHSKGFANYIKGKNAAQITGISADGSDADLAALCTIDITEMQQAVLKALGGHAE